MQKIKARAITMAIVASIIIFVSFGTMGLAVSSDKNSREKVQVVWTPTTTEYIVTTRASSSVTTPRPMFPLFPRYVPQYTSNEPSYFEGKTLEINCTYREAK